ncbi:hypothetical protein ACF1BP_07385 [Streptomyces sp. NPDC014735]|uniref:hypothetical protein n=1 Tax=unclassified Streptomyces TaxID=2593676 RepID=UPI00093BE000|nr:hypothetical protein [Streptomyces sp. CB01580]OKJ36413.1 hypothetical protein AMK22_15385 [Streptomyces sp. CB01580]
MHWAVRQDFDRRSGTLIGWGLGLLAVATGLLIWLGYLLLAPYTVHSRTGTLECDSPVADSSFQNTSSRCGPERDWPELMLIFALSVPPAVAGTALCVSGSTRRQTTAHIFEVIEMQKSEERLRAKQDAQGR